MLDLASLLEKKMLLETMQDCIKVCLCFSLHQLYAWAAGTKLLVLEQAPITSFWNKMLMRPNVTSPAVLAWWLFCCCCCCFFLSFFKDKGWHVAQVWSFCLSFLRGKPHNNRQVKSYSNRRYVIVILSKTCSDLDSPWKQISRHIYVGLSRLH